jgi:hypothetical protein
MTRERRNAVITAASVVKLVGQFVPIYKHKIFAFEHNYRW